VARFRTGVRDSMSARVTRTLYLVVNIVKSALLLLAPAAKKVVGERSRVGVLRGVGGLGGCDDGLRTAVGELWASRTPFR
jgi:hypothetical protein